jgi:hypothetical protein
MFLADPFRTPKIQKIVPGRKINRATRYCMVRKVSDKTSGSLKKIEKSPGKRKMRTFNITKNAAKKLRE